MVVLEGRVVQEWVLAIGKCICPHTPTALASLSTTTHIGGDLVVVAEDVLLQHVSLVEGLRAEVTSVLANAWGVVFVMLEVDV